MLSVTVGTSEATYAFNGRSGDIDLMLWPVNFTLAYVGYTVLSPFVAYGVEAGLRYSDEASIAERLRSAERRLASTLTNLDAVQEVPFNKMSDWGQDGRVLSTAAVYSPFVRQRQQLDLA